MSMEYCEECDKMIDLDYDSEHEHFNTELKTLKDMGNKKVQLASVDQVVGIDELKAEAIKWIKEDILDYRQADLHLPAPPVGTNIHNFIVDQRRKWKDRLNITEEDLK